jgi:hypothetical protein
MSSPTPVRGIGNEIDAARRDLAAAGEKRRKLGQRRRDIGLTETTDTVVIGDDHGAGLVADVTRENDRRHRPASISAMRRRKSCTVATNIGTSFAASTCHSSKPLSPGRRFGFASPACTA